MVKVKSHLFMTIKKIIMKEIGIMGSCMGQVHMFGKMDQSTKAILFKAEKKEKANLFSLMQTIMRGIG